MLYANGTRDRQSTSGVQCGGFATHEGLALVDTPRCAGGGGARCYSDADCAVGVACNVPGPYGDHVWVQNEFAGYRCTSNNAVGYSTTAACTAAGCGACVPSGAICRLDATALVRRCGARCDRRTHNLHSHDIVLHARTRYYSWFNFYVHFIILYGLFCYINVCLL